MEIKNISATPRESERHNQGTEKLSSEAETGYLGILFLSKLSLRIVGGGGRVAGHPS